MSIQGGSLRIIINEPKERIGINLIGTILSDRGGKTLLVRLTTTLAGTKFQSNLLKLIPIDPKAKFKVLGQLYGQFVTGHLVHEQDGETELIFSGVVALD
jgi:hypothetical protein